MLPGVVAPAAAVGNPQLAAVGNPQLAAVGNPQLAAMGNSRRYDVVSAGWGHGWHWETAEVNDLRLKRPGYALQRRDCPRCPDKRGIPAA